jgi:phosphatidate cytidylyltransferase
MFSYGDLCRMGILVSIFATLGDLVESQIKRTCAVKDSGRLIPGHGGILDRIDSLLLVVPVSMIYLFLIL